MASGRESLTSAGSCGQLPFTGDLWRTFVPARGCEPCFLSNPSELDEHLAANLQHASVRDRVFEDGSDRAVRLGNRKSGAAWSASSCTSLDGGAARPTPH